LHSACTPASPAKMGVAELAILIIRPPSSRRVGTAVEMEHSEHMAQRWQRATRPSWYLRTWGTRHASTREEVVRDARVDEQQIR
jgi:hypothetical protein